MLSRDTHSPMPTFMRMRSPSCSTSFSKKLASIIDLRKRVELPAAPAPGNDTVYLTVVDRDRRAVSFINSLYSNFGPAFVPRKAASC